MNTQRTLDDFYIDHTAVVDEGVVIGKGSKIWHFSHLMSGCILGDNCSVGQNCFIATKVIIGNNVKIQNNVSLYEGLTCGDDVFIGPSVVFTNVINPRSAINRKQQYQSTKLERGASIGANATVVCGNDIGVYAFVGAGAVVTCDIPDYGLFVGNPAKQIGWISEYGHRLEFDAENIAVCPESGQTYELINNEKVIRLEQ